IPYSYTNLNAFPAFMTSSAPLRALPSFPTRRSSDLRFRTSREQSVWVLNQLQEHGWIEKQVDQATLQSTFAFTRYGRLFTEPFRSEEHTSELQSRENLVCRLLLEKKKK